jgi:hypothetical protein
VTEGRREAKARFARQSVAGVPPVKGTVEVEYEYSYSKAAASTLVNPLGHCPLIQMLHLWLYPTFGKFVDGISDIGHIP